MFCELKQYGPWVLLGALCLGGCDDEVTVGGSGGAGGGDTSSMGTGSAPSNILESAQLGDPHLLSAQRLAFGPGGVLLVGDGRSDRVVAIETGDTSEVSRLENAFAKIDNLTGAAADVIGSDVTASELQIEDVAVNPISWRTYVAVTRSTTLEAYVMWVDADGRLRMFDLHNVVHATVDVPPPEGNAALIADVVWTRDHVITSVTPQTFVRHELIFVPLPFAHESGASFGTTRIFHRAWGQWITELPMDRFFTFEHNGELFLTGSYTSSVVRFVASELEDGGSDAVGQTIFDFMDGRTVLDMVRYERDEQMFVLVSLSNFLFDSLPGAVRLDGELFYQNLAVNEQSPLLLDFAGNPLVEGVERAFDLDLALKLALRGDEHAIVLRANSLVTEELP